jgi:hypothetical protein
LQHVSGDIQCFNAVPVGRLAGDKLDLACFFEGFGGTITTRFTGGVTGFTLNDCDFTTFSAQFVNNERRAFRPDSNVIGGDKSFHIAASFFQIIHVDFFIEINQINAFFPCAGDRHDQIH